MSLDEDFGPCRPAGGRGVAKHELQRTPHSLQQLDVSSAAWLKSYLAAARDGLRTPQIVHQANNLLWLVDDPGEIWFAIEEVVHVDTGKLLYTYHGNYDVRAPEQHVTLGHPALLRGAENARIGGEIKWSRHGNGWIITNKSGRYGTRQGQTKAHLEAVAGKFNAYGISLVPTFYDP